MEWLFVCVGVDVLAAIGLECMASAELGYC